MEIKDVKIWVVMKASVTNPYKKYWSASVTLGNDVNGTGNTIEKAYKNLTKKIWESPYLFSKFLTSKLRNNGK